MIICHDVLKKYLPLEVTQNKYDFIFMDPPYEKGFLEKILTNAELVSCLAENGAIILEHSIKEKIPELIPKLKVCDQRKYGKTLITFLTLQNNYRAKPPATLGRIAKAMLSI